MRDADPTILRGAAAILRGHGWLQNEYGSNGGPRCLFGALHEASGEGVHALVETEARVLREFVGLPDELDLVDWNDDSERTAADVVTALEQAAEKVEADQ